MGEEVKIQRGLIKKSFFPWDIEIDFSKVFPMVVMATMSSGKSTLINALLGDELLPNRNEACTSKVYAILDDDTAKVPTVYMEKDDGAVIRKRGNVSDKLSAANEDDSIKKILITGEVKGVFNTQKSLLVIDTPGPNNSRDDSHSKVTEDVLSKLNGGLILYVINATQMGINDDKELLGMLRMFLNKHKKAKVVFVINKVDELDPERGEYISDLVMDTKKYLEDNGFENPEIIPVSALAASLFKKVLSDKELTRNEYKDFVCCYDIFAPQDNRMISYAITDEYPMQYEKKTLKGNEYSVASLLAAIENTGLSYLERYIQIAQIQSSKRENIKIRIRK